MTFSIHGERRTNARERNRSIHNERLRLTTDAGPLDLTTYLDYNNKPIAIVHDRSDYPPDFEILWNAPHTDAFVLDELITARRGPGLQPQAPTTETDLSHEATYRVRHKRWVRFVVRKES